jgi:predicted transcriptional regulator
MPISSPLSSITRLNATVKDLLIYLFDLAPLEIDLLFTLMKARKSLTVDDLAKKLSRDRTTIFRSVQKLVSVGICAKDTKTLKDGGYYHIYSAVDKETFKLAVEMKIKEVQQSFDRILKKYEEDIGKLLESF